jgi:hypothetical protein
MSDPQPAPTPDRQDNPYRRMPERIAPEDMIASRAVSPPADPEGGHSPDEWVVKWAAG